MPSDHTELDNFIASLGLTYVATFVPWSKSRNAIKNPKLQDYTINWKTTLSKGSAAFETDYSMGIGHLPDKIKPKSYGPVTVDAKSAVIRACEFGKYNPIKPESIHATRHLEPPALRDVLHALVMDADVINYRDFEDWAESCGYDTDSRKAEKIYRACMDIALKLRFMLGDSNLQKLREAFQDY